MRGGFGNKIKLNSLIVVNLYLNHNVKVERWIKIIGLREYNFIFFE